MLVPALKFLHISSEINLKYEYYNPQDKTHYLNINEFKNLNTNDSTKSLIEILSQLPSYFF